MNMRCEAGGCRQFAEFYDPMDNKLCSDCIQSNVETGEYSWEDCEAIILDSHEDPDRRGWDDPTDSSGR